MDHAASFFERRLDRPALVETGHPPFRASHLWEGRTERRGASYLAVLPVPGPPQGEVDSMEDKYPDVDGHHHERPGGPEAVVYPVLFGVGHAIKQEVHRHLGSVSQDRPSREAALDERRSGAHASRGRRIEQPEPVLSPSGASTPRTPATCVGYLPIRQLQQVSSGYKNSNLAQER